MSRYGSQGLLAVLIGLAAAACGDPELNTNLRPEGPPNVLAVLTQNPIDWDGNTLTEQALKCRYENGVLDPKAPKFVGDPITGGSLICPETETEFMMRDDHLRSVEPRIVDDMSWGIRIMFDELLNADLAETLVCDPETETCEGSLDETHPFTLKCADTELAYSGYYVPNGNSVTFPVGPSLFLRPANLEDLTFPTGTACSVTMSPDRIKDKDGVSVPDSDPSVSTNYKIDFKIADLALLAVDPAPGGRISPDPAAAGAAAFVFNASLPFDADTGQPLDPTCFTLKDSAGTAIDTYPFVGPYNSGDLTDAVYLVPDTATGIFLPGEYTAVLKSGCELTEVNGGTMTVGADQTTTFTVAFGKTGQTSTTGFNATKNIVVSFNNEIDMASVNAANFELFQNSPPTNPPVAFTVTVGNSDKASLSNIANNSLVFNPNNDLAPGTYVLRIKAGTEIKDVDGNTAKFSAPVAFSYVVPAAARTVEAQRGVATVASQNLSATAH